MAHGGIARWNQYRRDAGPGGRQRLPYLQTPHFPPSFAQCLQYLQFLQTWQGSAPVQVAENMSSGIWLVRRTDNMIWMMIETNRDLHMRFVLRMRLCRTTSRMKIFPLAAVVISPSPT